MPNRAKWAHFNRPKPKKASVLRRPFALILVMAGSLIAFGTVKGIREHVLWVRWFSARSGIFVAVPTASLFLLAAFVIALGVLVWYDR
jgi:hypothetical protein